MLTIKPASAIRRLLFVLMGASICCAEDEADTQFTIFGLSALKKQWLILRLFKYPLRSGASQYAQKDES
jgi:hypothetical protein